MTEQTQKCSKCGKSIPQGEGKQTKKGLLCAECAKKKKNDIIWGTIGTCLAVAAAVCIIVATQNKVDSFEGVGNINDDVAVENVEVKTFDISKAVAASSPTNVGGAIADIELFKSKVKNTLEGLSGEDTRISIPPVTALFELNSSEVSSSAKVLIEEFAKVYCQTNKEAVICVDGYTCDLGSDSLNNVLSAKRANAVKQILVSAGVPSDKITAKGYGSSMYGKLGIDGREANRRANVAIK